MKFSILLFNLLSLIIFATSCSNYSKNLFSKGEITISNIRYKDKVWNEELKFNRLSWYKEMTLAVDLHIAKISFDSKFLNWFSNDAKKNIKKCQSFYVAQMYIYDKIYSNKEVIDRSFLSKGILKINIPEFSENLKSHPDYDQWSFKLFRPFGLCIPKELNIKQPIKISIPGFREVNLSLSD